MKNYNETQLENFSTTVYARTSVNNMPMITALVPHTEEEQKQVDDVFAIAL